MLRYYLQCLNGEVVEPEEDYGVLPSDITTGLYIFLDDCCKYGDDGTYEALSMVTALSGIQPGQSIDVTISGGCPPYTWEATSPLSFTEYTTTTVSNTLYLDAGAEAQNEVSSYEIKDKCYVQSSPMSEPITGNQAIVNKDGNPWALVFIANTSDCYYDGTANEINYIPSFDNVTQVSCPNVGVLVTGLNPATITVPEDYTTPISLSITMKADGYKWADGSDVYGTAVMTLSHCGCVDDPAIAWDDYTSDDYIEQSGSATIAVTANNKPLRWEVSGSGFSLAAEETIELYNTLYASASATGTATITVTGCDGVQTQGTVTQCECSEQGSPVGQYLGNTHVAWCAHNVANMWCGVFLIPLSVMNMGYYASQADAIAARDASGMPGGNDCDYWGVPSASLVGSDAGKWDAVCRYYTCFYAASPVGCVPASPSTHGRDRRTILYQWSYPAPGYTINDLATPMDCERIC